MPVLPPGDLLDSLSKDGKSGVPGGVRSLEKGFLQSSIKGQHETTNFNMTEKSANSHGCHTWKVNWRHKVEHIHIHIRYFIHDRIFSHNKF